jgi:hypothetical protein
VDFESFPAFAYCCATISIDVHVFEYFLLHCFVLFLFFAVLGKYSTTGATLLGLFGFFLAVLRFELRTSQLLYHLSPFALIILEIGPHFLPGSALSVILLFKLPTITGMTGPCHHRQLISVEVKSWELFCPSWPQTAILLISDDYLQSQVTGITNVSH